MTPADTLQTLHFGLNLLLVAVVATHLGAALKHHFVDRDDILRRMLPRLQKENRSCLPILHA
jgi:cytochrome b561